MRFTVTWHDDVANQLAALVVRHRGTRLGQQITEAANRIDRELSRNPVAVSRRLVTNVRLLVVEPLAVEYSVYDDDRQVRLLGYHRCPPRA